MIIHPGTSARLVNTSASAAGVTTKDFVVQSDSVLVSVWVSSITGSLTVELLDVLDETQESVALSLPPFVAPSTAVFSQQSGTVTSNVRIRATYTGACDFQVHVRAVGPVSSGSISGSVSITGGTIDTITNPVTVTGTVSIDSSTPVDVNLVSPNPLPITGTVIVDEGIVQEMLNAPDLNATYTWLDFGTRNERVSTIVYTAPSVTAQTLTKTFTYSLVSGKYRQDTVSYSLV